MKKQFFNYGISHWYPTLADYTFPTTFVKLKEEELDWLANEVIEEEKIKTILNRITNAQHAFSGSTFVTTDTIAPTDTKRFLSKKGAVHSAESAWYNLTKSKKVKFAAQKKEFEYICVRPFRNMTYPREFRLFIFDGKLKLMSQYWLTRHFYRLDNKKDFYWTKAKEFIEEISWLLPAKDIVVDIYFTSSDRIIIIDFNSWGSPTLPLLAETWNLDWTQEFGIKLLPESKE